MLSLQWVLWMSCSMATFTAAGAWKEPAKRVGEWEEETEYYQAIGVTSLIFHKKSEYQSIEIYQSKHYGKILMLDGVLQLTEVDANAYNEMLAHMAMMQHKNPKRALIIGGGDGYVLSEVLKHDSIEHVDHVDLDEEVVKACKEHFSWGAAWDDPRVTLHIADGAAFVEKTDDAHYDIVIQDSSDPWTTDDDGENRVMLPSSVLYSEKHFANIYRILTPAGVFNFQAEAFSIPSDIEGVIEWRKLALGLGFQRARYGSLYISSYSTGQIGFLLCEKDPSEGTSMEQVNRRFGTLEQNGKGTSYYQPKLQKSAFDLPLWVERAVYEDGLQSEQWGPEL